MSNREKFKETFGKMGMSEEKLRDIENLEIPGKKRYGKYAVAFASICVIVFLSGKMFLEQEIDPVTYELVTGEITYYAAENAGEIDTEPEFMEEKKKRIPLREEHVMVNNDRLSDAVVDVYVDENGLTCYVFSDGLSSGTRIEEPKHTSVFIYEIKDEQSGGTTGGITQFCGRLKKIDDRVYLSFSDYEEGIDITDDFTDGVATGKMEWTLGVFDDRLEEIFVYRVEGTLEDYIVDVWWMEGK